MALSEYYDDSSVISQLRSFFDLELQDKLDFGIFLSMVEDYDEETYIVEIKHREFFIDKITGEVVEKE